MIALVTGSRAYSAPLGDLIFLIDSTLRRVRAAAPDRSFAVMHGSCPHPRNGGGWSIDTVADRVARAAGWGVLARPADWSGGPGAGPARNAAMVAELLERAAQGTWVCCVPFPHPDPSKRRGTDNCVRLARAAGILVIE